MTPNASAPGCLLCLLDLSGSMRATLSRKRPITKLQGARLLLDFLLERVASLAAETGSGPDVAVVGYRVGDNGTAEIIPLLAGTSTAKPWLAATSLVGLAPPVRRRGPRRWVVAEPSGEADAGVGLRFGHSALIGWIEDHVGSAPPLVVHCAGGPPVGPAVDRMATSIGFLATTQGQAALAHCLFLEGQPASLGDPAVGHRGLSVNRWPWREVLEIADRQAGPGPVSVVEPARISPAFEARSLFMPKEGMAEASWEDAYASDPGRGLAAIADGASTGIYCKVWSRLLADNFVADGLALDDPVARAGWLQACRQELRSGINFATIRATAKNKYDTVGAAATFLGLRLHPATTEGGPVRWDAWAVGDACLLLTRGGRLLGSFPAVHSGDFGLIPTLFRTLVSAGIPAPIPASGTCEPGDLLILSTDAIAQAMIHAETRGTPFDLEALWDIDQETWRAQVQALRVEDGIVDDDCTLLMLRILSTDAGEVEPLEG